MSNHDQLPKFSAQFRLIENVQQTAYFGLIAGQGDLRRFRQLQSRERFH
jgi:hypothetical protein